MFMSAFYIVAGLLHFTRPEMYVRIIPSYLPAPSFFVWVSGAAEFLLGALVLIPRFRRRAAWGVIALLVAVFPANIYMYQQGGAAFGVPNWALLVRLPLQGILILWAYWFT